MFVVSMKDSFHQLAAQVHGDAKQVKFAAAVALTRATERARRKRRS